MIGPIILQIVLIFLNATFASAEIAVISMNDNKLKRMAAEGDKPDSLLPYRLPLLWQVFWAVLLLQTVLPAHW